MPGERTSIGGLLSRSEGHISMPLKRHLIVNADDFGLSRGVNRGIIQAHECGIVSSASLMVRGNGAEDAAAYGCAHPELSVGLHLDFGEWVYQDEEWTPRYEVVPLDDAVAVAKAVAHQLAEFRALTGKNPTHIDSHQHAHRDDPARSIVARIATDLGVPLRHFTPIVRYCGDFYGQTAEGQPYPEGISTDNLIRLLTSLPSGITELACHPGFDDDLCTVYRAERTAEIQALCDPSVRTVIVRQQIILSSFLDLLPELTGSPKRCPP